VALRAGPANRNTKQTAHQQHSAGEERREQTERERERERERKEEEEQTLS
jgi:hypothetical protein